MKKKLLFILAALCGIAAAIMFTFKGDSHLSELGDAWWIPFPLGAVALLGAMKSK